MKGKSICIICGTEFEHYGERILCSRACTAKYMSQMRVGENNPSAKTHPPEKRICKQCGEKFEFKRIGLHKGQDRFFCSSKCSSEFQKGKTKGTWLPCPETYHYPRAFRDIREWIIKRDGLCVLCGGTNRLQVHHVDYDKNNNGEDNLITLCVNCHAPTSSTLDRTFWENVFNILKSGSKLVKKGWGFEGHIVNDEKYCLKYLVFLRGKEFSYHYHKVKDETWHCLHGEFVMRLKDETLKFSAGDKIRLRPGEVHQLSALKNSIITEVSTIDSPEDSYRIQRGD